MLNDLQAWIAPYLDLLGDHPWAKALVIVVVFLVLAWIFDRLIVATLKKLTKRTQVSFDDRVIEYLHKPIYFSVILIGIALAVNLLAIAAPFEAIIYSSLKTIAYAVTAIPMAQALGKRVAEMASRLAD